MGFFSTFFPFADSCCRPTAEGTFLLYNISGVVNAIAFGLWCLSNVAFVLILPEVVWLAVAVVGAVIAAVALAFHIVVSVKDTGLKDGLLACGMTREGVNVLYTLVTIVNLAALVVSIVAIVVIFVTWFVLGIVEGLYVLCFALAAIVARKEQI